MPEFQNLPAVKGGNSYDAQYRLTAESASSTTITNYSRAYTFDLAGNRLTLTKIDNTTTNVTDYTYDKLNRLLTAVTGATTVNYAYDLNGSRTNKTDGVITTGYVYDTLNRLVSANTNGVTVFTAQYDYRTRRLTKDEGTAAYFRYDSGDSFQETTSGVTPSINVEFVRGSGMGGGIGSILYSDRRPALGPIEHFTYNAVGHTVAMTDVAGAPTKTDLYEAFGNITSSSGTSSNNRLANTKERDFSLGLDNHGHRYFDPEIGRYISRDPIGYGDGLNVYLYVHNNPINNVDPLGLYTGADDAAAAGIGALIGFGTQLAFDVYHSVRAGKVQVSGWQDYTAATAGGAAGGVAFLYSGPVGAGVLGAATANATRQTLNTVSGKQKGVSLKSFAVETTVGGVTGAVVPQIGKAIGAAVEGTESLVNQAVNKSAGQTAPVAVNDLVEGGVNKVAANTVAPKVLTLNGDKYPVSAANLEEAGAVNTPLPVNRAGADANRNAALQGLPKIPGYDLDEAPPAMFRKPGDPVVVRPTPPGDNRGAGASLGRQAKNVADGGKVVIQIKREASSE